MGDTSTTNPVGASIGSGLGNVAATTANYFFQKALMRRQNEMMWDNFKRAGATPAAIAAGVTGNASSPSAPTVSTGGNPFPDLGQTAIGAQNANTQQNVGQSQIDINQMRLQFDPQKYYADCQKALAEAFSSSQQGLMYGSMKENFDELNKDLRGLRPWKISSAKQSFMNLLREYDNLVAENGRIKSETYRNYKQGYEAQSQGDLNYQLRDEGYQRTFNLQLDQFRKQWELDLLAQGIDVNKPFWENVKRLMYTNPEQFKRNMDLFVRSLNILDNRLQDNLGEHYKRNIALAGAAYGFNKIHQQNANNRMYRLGIMARSIASFIPFGGGSMPLSPASTSPSFYDIRYNY